MTARTTMHNTVTIDILPGENPKEELSKYIQELEGRGHEMLRTATEEVLSVNPPQRFTCKRCKQSVRVYIHSPTGSFFSDFKEGEQCSKRQQNIMFVLTYAQVCAVMAVWRAEQITSDLDSPSLSQQQYVLFDENYMWPNSGGWP